MTTAKDLKLVKFYILSKNSEYKKPLLTKELNLSALDDLCKPGTGYRFSPSYVNYATFDDYRKIKKLLENTDYYTLETDDYKEVEKQIKELINK